MAYCVLPLKRIASFNLISNSRKPPPVLQVYYAKIFSPIMYLKYLTRNTKSTILQIQGVISLNIKEMRERKGISRVVLAERIGVHPSYVSHLENGIKTNPTLEVLQAIAKELNCKVSDLLGEKAS